MLTLFAGFSLFCFPQTQLFLSPLRLQNTPSIQYNLSIGEEPSQGAGGFLPSQLPPQSAGPLLIFLFLFPFFLPIYMEVFLSFWIFDVFCQHSVAVLCESFHL